MRSIFCIIVITSLIVIGSPVPPVSAASAVASPQIPRKIATKSGPLRAVGNKVLEINGAQYIPEGISIYGGLEDPNYNVNSANVYAQITASVKYWHANTVRLQVAESNLFSMITPGYSYNNTFLQDIIRQVNYIHHLHAVAVINDQTEFTSNLPNPTNTTSRFWQVMSRVFGNKPYVIFDLFNEPRLETINSTNRQLSPDVMFSLFGVSRIEMPHQRLSQMKPAQVWRLWKYGGTVNGITYLGMQTLVNQIESYHVDNLLWIEGPNEARELPHGRYLLSGRNLVYSIHHPNLNSPRSWRMIGQLAANRPVVDGEWAQYQSAWAECYSDAYTNAPLYIAYLHSHNIGIIAWSLQPNSLLKGDSRIKPNNTNETEDGDFNKASELQTPDMLEPNYSCSNRYGEGAGQLLQQYFKNNSKPVDA